MHWRIMKKDHQEEKAKLRKVQNEEARATAAKNIDKLPRSKVLQDSLDKADVAKRLKALEEK